MVGKKIKFGFVLMLLFIIFSSSYSNFLTIDHTYSISSKPHKILSINNFKNIWWHMETLKFLLNKFNMLNFYFQFSLLIASILSIFFIKDIFTAFIFIFSPFMYTRILAGQLGIIIAFLLLPFFLHFLFKFMNTPTNTNAIKVSLAFFVISSFQIHFMILNLIILLLALIFLRKKSITKYIRPTLIIFLLIFLLNTYWLQGFFIEGKNIGLNINKSHKFFFSPKLSQGIPAVAKIIGMWGFWREAAYITPYKTLPIWLWYSLLGMFVVTMLVGYYKKKSKEEQKKANFFFILWWLGIILATGISHPYTAPIFDFLFKHVPFFNGFRDSHKFVVFILLAYAYLCPLGIYKIKEWIENRIIKLQMKISWLN